MSRRQVTEYLVIDLRTESWRCARCDHEIGPARENYKRGLLLYDRDPREVHAPGLAQEPSFSPDPAWCRIVEYYCPGCGTLVEAEYLPPGHPLTHDIEIDVDGLQSRSVSTAPAEDVL